MPFCRVLHFVGENFSQNKAGPAAFVFFPAQHSTSKNEMVSYKLCLLCKKHHCQKDGWCLQKGIFLQNEGHEKSMSAHYQLFLSPSGVHPIFGEAGSVVKIWLLQNNIAFWGIKVQIVPYHFVSKQILGAHPFCRLFSMPPILCL